MNVSENFGLRLRYLRKLKGWTLEELAFESGINRNYLSNLENGSRNPTLKMLNKLSLTFEMTLSELLKGVENIPV